MANRDDGARKRRRPARGPEEELAGRDARTDEAAAKQQERRSLSEEPRGTAAEHVTADYRKARSKTDKRREASEDDSRDVRFPYWASVNGDERIELEGTPARGEGRQGRAKALR